jgi:hypothetical protein
MLSWLCIPWASRSRTSAGLPTATRLRADQPVRTGLATHRASDKFQFRKRRDYPAAALTLVLHSDRTVTDRAIPCDPARDESGHFHRALETVGGQLTPAPQKLAPGRKAHSHQPWPVVLGHRLSLLRAVRQDQPCSHGVHADALSAKIHLRSTDAGAKLRSRSELRSDRGEDHESGKPESYQRKPVPKSKRARARIKRVRHTQTAVQPDWSSVRIRFIMRNLKKTPRSRGFFGLAAAVTTDSSFACLSFRRSS